MDRVTAIVWGLVALGAICVIVVYWNRRAPHGATDRRSSRRVLPGKNAGRPARSAGASHRQPRISKSQRSSLAASAFQRATDVKRAKQANSKDEEELMRLFGRSQTRVRRAGPL